MAALGGFYELLLRLPSLALLVCPLLWKDGPDNASRARCANPPLVDENQRVEEKERSHKRLRFLRGGGFVKVRPSRLLGRAPALPKPKVK